MITDYMLHQEDQKHFLTEIIVNVLYMYEYNLQCT